MKNTTTATQQILQLLAKHHALRPIELHKITNISRQRIHSQLKALLLSDQIVRKGQSPLTYYSLKTESKKTTDTILQLSDNQREIIDQDFLIIKRQGTQVTGQRAVCDYAQEYNTDPQQVAEKFAEARDQQKKIIQQKDGEQVNQKNLLQDKISIDAHNIEHYECEDFTEVEGFGETALAKKVHAAKSSENAVLQMEIFRQTERRIHKLISDHGIDAVAFIPGATSAGKAFMKVWQETLDLPLPHVNLIRVTEETSVPQKAISLQTDRADHAQSTIVLGDHRHHGHVLILDDSVISGTSLHQAASALIQEDAATKVSVYTLLFDRKV